MGFDEVVSALFDGTVDVKEAVSSLSGKSVKEVESCQCEDKSHIETRGCQNPQELTLETMYGPFEVCYDCKDDGHMQEPFESVTEAWGTGVLSQLIKAAVLAGDDANDLSTVYTAAQKAGLSRAQEVLGRMRDVDWEAFLNSRDADPIFEEVVTEGYRDSAVPYILPEKELLELYNRLGKDKQSKKLLLEIRNKLSERLSLSADERMCINRLRDMLGRVKFFTTTPGLARNNIFKCANHLGIKLPSGAF